MIYFSHEIQNKIVLMKFVIIFLNYVFISIFQLRFHFA